MLANTCEYCASGQNHENESDWNSSWKMKMNSYFDYTSWDTIDKQMKSKPESGKSVFNKLIIC